MQSRTDTFVAGRGCRAAWVAFLLLPGVARGLAAQRPADTTERRFRFAETFIGLDVATQPEGRVGRNAVPSRPVPRFTIGGLHFWGYADFAVAFPVARLGAGDEGARSRLTTGVETRARLYPHPVRGDGWSPFLGGGLGAIDLQVGDGPREYRMRPMLQGGLLWRRGSTMVEGGWSWRPTNDLTYPQSRTVRGPVDVPGSAIWLGVHRTYETTASIAGSVRSGAAVREEQTLRQAGRLSGPSLAAGLSSPILTGSAAYNTVDRPWLAARPRGAPLLDLGLGWYFDAPDVHINLAWRAAHFDQAAFGFRQENRRRSLGIEAYKFLFDYHGFVPFGGMILSQEWLRMRETFEDTRVSDFSRSLVTPGVVFGWDIRPTRTQRWILRTNLRYYPRLRLPVAGGEQALDQLEFNFIQLVWYPRR